MKILTILIFSGDRLSIEELLEDVAKLKKFEISIRIVDWTKDKKKLEKKKKIYSNYKKKINDFKIQYDFSNSWKARYKKYVNIFKSKYILIIGDDDRINILNFKKILNLLKYNYSGITFSYKSFQKNHEILKYYRYKIDNYSVRPFNLKNDLKKIGYISCHIIRTDLIARIFENEKKYLMKTFFPQNYIILGIISKFNNWSVSNLECIFNRSGSLNIFKLSQKKLENYLNISSRLKSEYLGYLHPLKRNFTKLNENQFNELYKDIFFNNILSWLFVSVKFIGKKKTFNNINNIRNIIKEPIQIQFILKFIYICPIILLDLLKFFRKFFRKILNAI